MSKISVNKRRSYKSRPRQVRPREIEQTSKSLKLHIIMAILTIFAGAVAGMASAALENKGLLWISAFMAGSGLTWYIITKFRIWWNHG